MNLHIYVIVSIIILGVYCSFLSNECFQLLKKTLNELLINSILNTVYFCESIFVFYFTKLISYFIGKNSRKIA